MNTNASYLLLGAIVLAGLHSPAWADGTRLGVNAHPNVMVAISPILPIEPHAPSVKLTIYNGSNQPVALPLPAGDEEMKLFGGLNVIIDGVPAKFKWWRPETDTLFESVVRLNPGTNVEMVVALNLIYDIPPDWHEMRVSPSNVHNFFRIRSAWEGSVILTSKSGSSVDAGETK